MEGFEAEGIYNPLLAICAIVLIPVFVWWVNQNASLKTKLFGYFLILAFAQGSIELLGVINNTVLRFAFELPVIVLYLICLFKNKKKYSYRGRALILPFIAVAVISGIQTGPVMTILFLLRFLEIFMLLYFFRNSFNWKDTQKLNTLLVALASSQIFASFIKFALVGIMEPYIGTMSSHAGGITTLFSLVAFCISLEMYLCTKKSWMLLLTLGFILFGFIGEKRALAFFFPAFYIIITFVNAILNKASITSIKMTLVGLVVMPLLFIGACILMPSFNPEEKVGGSFDMDYVVNFSEDYTEGNGYSDSGRANAHSIAFARIASDDWYRKLFGNGSGALVASKFNKRDYSDEGRMKQYGIGYSTGVGFISMLLQVGILGTLLYFVIFIALMVDLIRRLTRVPIRMKAMDRGWVVSAILSLICVVVISFLYNDTAFYFNPISLLIFWNVAYAYKLLDRQNRILNIVR